MYKNVAHKNNSVFSKNVLERDAKKIIKKALAKAKDSNLRDRLEDLLLSSVDNAKEKSSLVHRKVAKYTYKKPYTSLGTFMLTGALVGFLVTKLIDKR